MKIRDIIDLAVTVIITLLVCFMFLQGAEASYRPPINSRSNNQLMRRVGQLNRQEVRLLNQRNRFDNLLPTAKNGKQRSYYHAGYNHYDNSLRKLDQRRESMVQMLVYPDLILVD